MSMWDSPLLQRLALPITIGPVRCCARAWPDWMERKSLLGQQGALKTTTGVRPLADARQLLVISVYRSGCV
jgi:hypothetical protein